MSTELTEAQKGGAVATFDYGTDAGSGFENQTSADVSIGYLSVLQALSPQVADGEMSNGNLANTATDEEYDGATGVNFVASYTQRLFVEWLPDRGGLVGRHAPDSPIVAEAKEKAVADGSEFGPLLTAEGNVLTETFYVYGVLCTEDGSPEPVVLSFTSTKIKVYKSLMSRLRKFQVETPDGRKVRPPMFAHLLNVTTAKETNKHGPFNNFAIKPANGDVKDSLLATNDARFLAAKDVKDAVESGKASAATETSDSAASGGPTPF